MALVTNEKGLFGRGSQFDYFLAVNLRPRYLTWKEFTQLTAMTQSAMPSASKGEYL